MTVKELRDFLAPFPEDMEILETRYSDLGPMGLDNWGTILGVRQVSGRYGWVQRVGAMTDENRRKVKTYVHFAGH